MNSSHAAALRVAAAVSTASCPVPMAPVQDQLKPAELAAWIHRDRLPGRMQVQLHKAIWGNEPGR